MPGQIWEKGWQGVTFQYRDIWNLVFVENQNEHNLEPQ